MIAETVASPRRRPRITLGRILLYAFISVAALLWLVPIAGAIFASFRPYADTVRDGFFSWPQSLTLDNYRNAWEQGDILRKYWNTVVILVPALLLTLFFSSMVAFVASRFSWRFNILMLSIFTAGNLLPQQIIIQPLFQFYNRVELPEWLSNSGRLNGSAAGGLPPSPPSLVGSFLRVPEVIGDVPDDEADAEEEENRRVGGAATDVAAPLAEEVVRRQDREHLGLAGNVEHENDVEGAQRLDHRNHGDDDIDRLERREDDVAEDLPLIAAIEHGRLP